MRYFYFYEMEWLKGKFLIVEKNGYIIQVSLHRENDGEARLSQKEEMYLKEAVQEETPLIRRTACELEEYFQGRRTSFDLPLNQEGTPFQKKVWSALREIPYGTTKSYGEIAKIVGSPKGARAVGMACNRNEVLIITPCHRVIGASGALTGFGGGIDIKEILLGLESEEK